MAFVGAERALRRDAASRTMESVADDRGTTRGIGVAYAVGMAAPLLNLLRVVPLPRRVQILGPVVMLVGFAVRVWAALSLGRYYTRTLRTAAGQPLVESGPYGLVRHPGYAGDLVMWLGFGLASGNGLVLGLVEVAMWLVYARRITAEETMLTRQLGEGYVRYQDRTARLVPGLY